MNVFQSILLPMAILPVLKFTADARIMGHFKNPLWLNVLVWAIGALVIFVNGYLTLLVLPNEHYWRVLIGILGTLRQLGLRRRGTKRTCCSNVVLDFCIVLGLLGSGSPPVDAAGAQIACRQSPEARGSVCQPLASVVRKHTAFFCLACSAALNTPMNDYLMHTGVASRNNKPFHCSVNSSRI